MEIKSEHKLQRKLNRSRAADLIQRIEATVRAARAETARERLRRVAEKSIGQRVVRWAEVGVVEDIEEL